METGHIIVLISRLEISRALEANGQIGGFKGPKHIHILLFSNPKIEDLLSTKILHIEDFYNLTKFFLIGSISLKKKNNFNSVSWI